MSQQRVKEFCSKFERGREIPTAANSPEAVERHLRITGGRPRFRFPPEPNGYLHIGHAKSMVINFGGARETGGTCYLRFDDTNPETENQEYIDSILEAVRWLGWVPDRITYSSDYFDQLYRYAEQLISSGKAYVDDSTHEEMKRQREHLLESPRRNRPSDESLQLFREMRKGIHPDGSLTLRLRCDEEGYRDDNPNLRDPVAYRIKHTSHHRTGDRWCLYPSYDFTHCICDSLEEIDYSICTLEFETRREPYYWILDTLGLWKPHVYEFARLNIEGALLSKRRINDLIKEGGIDGWDDPRLFTVLGMRRRGFTPAAINAFCRETGVSRGSMTVEREKVQHFIRQDLDENAERRMGVLRPLRVTLTNFSEQRLVEAPNHPKRPELGSRQLPLSRTLYIESTDFRIDPPPKYWRLSLGKTVGLKYGPNITCDEYLTDEKGEVSELRCRVDFEKRVKPKAHIHWISEVGRLEQGVSVNLYSGNRRETLTGCLLEKNLLATFDRFATFQFERVGYYCFDPVASSSETLVFNETVELKSSQ
jgi:glutaminyl-tRNA synthetase